MGTQANMPGMWNDGGALPAEDQTYGGGAGADKVDPQSAGYMELEGAQKSGDCNVVEVDGGVSGERGLCHLFLPQQGAGEFECEQCQHFGGQQSQEGAPGEEGGEEEPAGNQWAGTPAGGGQWSGGA